MNATFELTGVQFVSLLLIQAGSLLVLLRGIYFRYTPNRDSLFAFFLFGMGVFLITHLLHNVDMSMGFAFGLFAVFSMLRYRTESMSIRDMTYLFLVIVVALLSAVAPVHYVELMMLNALICMMALLAESRWFAPRMHEKRVLYENIENIKQENKARLIRDLSQRTGLDIVKVEVVSIDFLRDVAELDVFFRATDDAPLSAPSSHAVSRYDVGK